MFCLAVLLFSATVWAEYTVYEITNTRSSIAGLYVEIKEKKAYQQSSGTLRIFQAFQRIGGKDDIYLLWPNSQSREWVIGYEGGKGFAVAYKAKTETWQGRSVPPESGWESTSGKDRTFKVIWRASLVSTMEEVEASGGSVTRDESIICLKRNSNKWIFLEYGDPKICDKINHCNNGLDEVENEKCQHTTTTTKATTTTTIATATTTITQKLTTSKDDRPQDSSKG